MAQFLTTNAGASCIEQIIITAKSKVFLFCPYLKIPRILFERLMDTNRRNVEVHIVYGKSDLKSVEKEKLLSLGNVTLYFLENLHAKCYFNERYMMITSMNLYEFSEKNNREMGVLLDLDKDLNAFTEAYKEGVSILKNASKIAAEKPVELGYCIRCAGEIKKDGNKPFCLNCYRQWSRFKNKSYAEKYCHYCRKETQTNIEMPLCSSCKN